MGLLNKFEQALGEYVPENLTLYLLVGQVALFGLLYAYPEYQAKFMLQGASVLAGEYWRIFSFLFIPITMSPLFAAFTWYIYYLFGTALEQEWGHARYALYILVLYVVMVIGAFVFPHLSMSNTYIFSSLFLAFAHLYPEFTLNIFFVLPVKVKWLALLTWGGVLMSILVGTMAVKIMALFSVSNYLLFFGKDLLQNIKDKSRQTTQSLSKSSGKLGANMRCAHCSATEHDRKIFYYCDTCVPSTCYCDDHIQEHEHRSVS